MNFLFPILLFVCVLLIPTPAQSQVVTYEDGINVFQPPDVKFGQVCGCPTIEGFVPTGGSGCEEEDDGAQKNCVGTCDYIAEPKTLVRAMQEIDAADSSFQSDELIQEKIQKILLNETKSADCGWQ